MFYNISPLLRGISIGTLTSIALGLLYLVLLHEPGPAFYPFAGLIFLVCPLIGGVAAIWKAQKQRRKNLAISIFATFGASLALFIVAYVIIPIFDRTSIRLPETCNHHPGAFNPPPSLAYTLPNNDTGVLIKENAQFALVATADYQKPPFPSMVFLVDKFDKRVIKTMSFNDDIIIAAVDGNTFYFYNDKIGYFIDARSGALENNILTIDNYGGLSGSENPILLSPTSSDLKYYEISAVITTWGADGSVNSRRHLDFNGIALGCFVDGSSRSITLIK